MGGGWSGVAEAHWHTTAGRAFHWNARGDISSNSPLAERTSALAPAQKKARKKTGWASTIARGASRTTRSVSARDTDGAPSESRPSQQPESGVARTATGRTRGELDVRAGRALRSWEPGPSACPDRQAQMRQLIGPSPRLLAVRLTAPQADPFSTWPPRSLARHHRRCGRGHAPLPARGSCVPRMSPWPALTLARGDGRMASSFISAHTTPSGAPMGC